MFELLKDKFSRRNREHQACVLQGDIRLSLIPVGVLSELTNNEVVPFIMKAERFHGHLIASTNPVRAENIVCFLNDLDQLQEPEDLLSNDLGSWNECKTAVKKVCVHHRKGRQHYEDYKTTFLRRRLL